MDRRDIMKLDLLRQPWFVNSVEFLCDNILFRQRDLGQVTVDIQICEKVDFSSE